jgi:hypothetical protein
MKNNNEIDLQNMDTLIHKLQSKDREFKKAVGILQIFFFVLMLIYVVVYVFNPDLSLNQRIGGICYVLAFSLLAFHFRKKHTKYKNVNYSASVKELMTEAEKRYRFWKGNQLISSVLAIILLDVGTYLILIKYSSDKWSLLQIFFGVQVFYLISAAIGFIIGFINWKKEIRPFWKSLKTMLKEFEE